jgi:urease accessory protein
MNIFRRNFALVALVLSQPALAHHPMGGATPANLTQGLLSGLGHPVIGIDHLLFIAAVGVTVFYFGQRVLMIAALLIGALLGALLHVQSPSLPYHDALVALSLIILGVLLVRRHALLRHPMAALLFAASGMAHGYAYGEAIVGAETTPLLAYLSGFTMIQFAIALAACMSMRYVIGKKPGFDGLRAAGGALAAAGAGFLVFAISGLG